MGKQYTIKDLAKELKLHHTTISRALRNHPDVNEKTREMVLEAARKYNYVPNSFAKSLRSSKSKTIVVMVPVIKNFFFSEVLGVIIDLAFQAGYSVMINQSNEDGEMELQNLDAIMKNRVAGVIASVANVKANKDNYLQLKKLGIPVVLFDRFFEDEDFSKVVINNYQGAFEATEYLVNSGRKSIAFYLGQEDNPVFQERYHGYLDALDKHKIPVNSDLIICGGIDLEDGIELINKIIATNTETDALLCAVDMVALGVISGSRELGIHIPDDLALIGFDNEPAGRIIRPALTTVAQPVDKIGKTAFDLLLLNINHKAQQSEIIELKMELIKRESA